MSLAMTLQTTPRLPVETIEAIIDQAEGDLFVLRALSLTCRALLPRCRLHLCRSVKVDNWEQRDSIRQFFRQHPHLKTAVYSMDYTIRRDSYKPHSPEELTVGTRRSATLIIPFPSLFEFTNLRHWTLRCQYQFTVSFHRQTLTVLRAESCIEVLTLEYIIFLSYADFLRLITALPRLRHLRYSMISFERTDRGLILEPNISRYKKLNLDALDAHLYYSPRQLIASVLYLARSTLAHFDLRLSITDNEFDIPDLTRLQSVTIWIPHSDRHETFSCYIGSVIAMLQKLQSPTFKHLSLKFLSDYSLLKDRLSHADVLEQCHELDRVCSNLKVKLFAIATSTKMNRLSIAIALFEAAFPMLHRSGNLEVKPGSSASGHGHDSSLTSLEFSPDGRWIASTSSDKSFIIWDALHQCSVIDQVAEWPAVVIFSPDSKRVIVASKAVQIWSVCGDRLTTLSDGPHNNHHRRIAWSSDGSVIASAVELGKTILLWDANTYELLRRIHTDMQVRHILFSPNARWLVAFFFDSTRGHAHIWELPSCTLYKTISNRSARSTERLDLSTRYSCFDPTSERLAVALYEQCDIHIHDLVGNGFLTIPTSPSLVTTFVFSPDGKLLLSALTESTVKVWDAYTGQQLLSLGDHNGTIVNAACFSPNGKYIVSAADDKLVRLWRVSDGSRLAVLSEHRLGVSHVIFSPDGLTLASADHDGAVCIRRVSDIMPVGSA